jgi:hypothetical protein
MPMVEALLCPYCVDQPADTKDHIFPQFLGGKATILACKTCNNTFGHSFEAAAFTDFRGLMLIFRRCGMQPPKPMVWRKVALDHDGREYDVDQDLNAVLSDPAITRDQSGKIVGVEGDPRKVERIATSLEKKGKRVATASSELKIDLRRLRIRYPLDDNLRRFSVKMTLAVARRLGQNPAVYAECRRFLLSGEYSGSTASSPVRIALADSPSLKALRPALGHLVYVCHDEADGCCYSILQFFGAIQMYCELGSDIDAPGFSIVATHDPVSHREEFHTAGQIDFALPPQFVSQEQWGEGIRARFEAMRADLVELYGDQAPLALTPEL